MVTIVIVRNPFEPWNGREVQKIEYKGSVGMLLALYSINGAELQATINGYCTANTTQVNDGDFVVIFPVVEKGGGKSILGVIAAVALSVVAMGAGAAVAGVSSLGAATGMAAVGGYLTAAAIMFIGSSLVGRFMGTKVDTGKYSIENNPTYSWGDVQTMEGQNNAISVTYGKVMSAGQTIGKYVNVIDNKEYLNWLVSAGEGPLVISNIKLNDNDVGYYEGVQVDVRAGTNDQEVIDNFNDTYFTKELGYQLLETERIDTAQGNATEGLIVKVEFSQGLYYANDNGSLGEAWVELEGLYRKVGTSDWQELIGTKRKITKQYASATLLDVEDVTVTPGTYKLTIQGTTATLVKPNKETVTKTIALRTYGNIGGFNVYNSNKKAKYTISGDIVVAKENHRITGKQSSAIRKEYRIDNVPSGEYEVKMRIVARSHDVSNSRASVRCYWLALTSIVYDDFTYPNVALIGLKAMATDQLSGSPTLKFTKERATVLVYNPYVSEYEEKPANNPAWASYDMVHMASELYDANTDDYVIEVRGAKKETMLYDQFAEWAEFCESKKLYINIEINTVGEMLDVINQNIANVGRGMVVRFGTRYGCVWDCVKQPVQMFGMGNIIAGSFAEEFLATNDRANCVEVTYTDAESDYSRQTVTVYSDTYDEDPEEKAAQITFNGITSYEQAYREAKYQLYCNKYQLRTVSFEANIDAIACTIGDVILVAHDVPKWANSGRIYKVEGQRLTLPVELDNTNGAYRIMYRTVNDNLYSSSVSVLSNKDGWCEVSVTTPFKADDPPQVNDVFDIALSNLGSKPFVVKAITRAQDFTRKIEAIEYNEALYQENYTIPPINYTPQGDLAQNVTGLNASQVSYVGGDGKKMSRLYASWNMPTNGGRFTVLISSDGGATYSVLYTDLSNTEISADVTANTVYWIKVITVLGLSQSKGVTYGPIKVGKDSLPPDVLALEAEVISDGFRRYYWNFTYPEPNDIAGFRLKYIQGTNPNWNKAYEVQEGLVVSQPFETKTVRQGTHTIMIKAVDNSGQESENFAACVVDFGDLLEDNVLYKKDFSENLWADVETDGVKNQFDGYIHAQQVSYRYSTPEAFFYGEPTDYFYNEQYASLYIDAIFTAPASGNFWLQYDIEGAASLVYRIRNRDNIFKQYSTKVAVKAGDVIEIRLENQEGTTDTVIKKLMAIVDVPDREEHFKNINIPTSGVELAIATPNYQTTAVRMDDIKIVGGKAIFPQIVSYTPCVIKVVDINGNAVATTADVTWQGFINETL